MKILMIFIVFIIATPIFAVVKEAPGLKILFLFGLIAGISAIWKYNPEEEVSQKIETYEDNDLHKLDKK